LPGGLLLNVCPDIVDKENLIHLDIENQKSFKITTIDFELKKRK